MVRLASNVSTPKLLPSATVDANVTSALPVLHMVLWACVWTVIVGTSIGALWLKFADRDVSLWLMQLFKRQDSDAFAEKVIWITGASQGLGELLARHFAQKGAKLILSSRNAEKLEKVADACGTAENVHILPFDLRNANWDEIAALAHSSFSEGIDYLIHNAGMSQHALASETKAHVVDSMFQLNTIGPLALTQAVLPGMVNRGKGHIVVISSMAGKIPSPGQAIYAATKHAIMGYFHTVRAELAATSIGVTVCCPGPIQFEREGTVRYVYHNEGVIEERVQRLTGLPVHKAVQLIALAAEHRLSECWMAKQPVLLMAYITQYCPTIGSYLLDRIGPRRAAAVKRGNGYSVRNMLSKDKDK